MKTYFFSLTMALWLSFFAFTASASVRDGHYVGVGTQSDILVETNEKGEQRFLMNVLRSGHMCMDVAGTITGNQGLVDDEEELGLGVCELSFQQNHHILNIGIKDYEGCRQYCGMRASLDGSYRIPPPICTLEAITASRHEFKARYDQQQYLEAEAILNQILTRCDFYLDFVLHDSLRNDLALALYQQGDAELCLEVLSGTVALDQDLYLPLVEREIYEETESAIRQSWRLCGEGLID